MHIINKIYFKSITILVLVTVVNATKPMCTNENLTDNIDFEIDINSMQKVYLQAFNCQEQELNAIIKKLSEPITPEELEKLKNEIKIASHIILNAALNLDEYTTIKDHQNKIKADLLIQQAHQAYNKRVQEYNAKIAIETKPVLKDNSILDPLIAYKSICSFRRN